MARSPEKLLWGVAVLAVGAVALAVGLQHGFGMAPCAWCVFQRLIFLALAAAALLSVSLHRARPAFIVTTVLTALLAALGVWVALYQQFFASQAGSCVFTFAERFLMRTGLDETLPWLFEATASCADANVPLLGVPFAVWSAALFVLLLLMCTAALRAGRVLPVRRRRR